DNKAKVSVGIPAIRRHFETMQKILEPVLETDESLRVADILLLVSNKRFDEDFRYNDEIKLLRVLLVNGGPDKNLRHFKNIIQYCKLFHFLNLDYLTIRTHALDQSAYNLVEKSISSLSKKVARITLLIDHFGNYLDSQENKRDLIYGKPVLVKYIDKQNKENSKNDDENNDDLSADEAAALLSASNGFLLPLIKEKNGYYLNAIHTLEYFDSIKILSYNTYLLSLFSENYIRYCCTICKQTRTNSAIVEDFSILSSLLGITDYEFIAIAIALGYVLD
ncbi:19050_t:CDS:2, partial [Gigaspora margarita]